MKKTSLLKKLFASLMTSALVMTSVVIPTDAAEDTINEQTPVSLTIHKYEMTGTSNVTGTGSANDSVPEGAKPLNDVEFTVYKIADIEQATDINGTTIKYKLLTDIQNKGDLQEYIDGGMSAADIQKNFVTNTEVNGILTDRTSNKAVKKTAKVDNVDGIAKFESTDLSGQGLYLVVETDAPAKVTSRVAPFIVSLPTTVQTNTNGSEWLYDVHAFPKNSTQLKSITINKSSKVPGESTSTAIADAKFKLEKYDDTTKAWIQQTTDGDGTALEDGGIITVPVGGKQINNLAPGKYRFVETEGPEGHIADTLTGYEFEITSEGKVLVNNTEGAAISVVNEKPTVEKEVLKKNGNTATASDWSDQTDYSVGDKVTFKINLTVPKTIKNLKRYKVTDTFTEGVFENVGNFKYKLYAGEGGSKSEVTSADLSGIAATVTKNNGKDTGWTLDLTTVKDLLYTNNVTAIEITYDATLTAEAITAGEGNKNKIELEFSNKAVENADDGNDKSDKTTTITDEVVVYTFGMQLVKSFEDGTASTDVKATFDLYEKVDSSETKLPGDSTISVKKIGTYTTDAEGKIVLDTSKTGDSDKGFSNGTYYFVETSTADGYNLLKKPVEVEIQKYYKKTFATTTTVTTYNQDGSVYGNPIVTTTGTEKTEWYSDSNLNTKLDTYATTEVKVVNKKGFSFPTTGGRGTIIFTVAGLVLMGAAVIVFFKTRKKSNV